MQCQAAQVSAKIVLLGTLPMLSRAAHHETVQYFLLIIWLAPRAGKMNQIACCDWLPERARWSHLARSGLPAISRKQNYPESHIINPLLTKFVRSRWLAIGLVLFLRVYGPRLRLGHAKKELGQYPAILTSHLFNNRYVSGSEVGTSANWAIAEIPTHTRT